MASPPDTVSMAVFCDFENVALGVRDAKYEKFDIKKVLERLLLKGSIVVKKAYCDWERYKGFKATMHEASFELIEIPHVRQSGKNSADIRLVVDALDLCYTKSHVNTFVIISGDSDFSPLVSKLRENAKQVIGVGVKQSSSDLLIANCDEFIYYDDLVRESQRAATRREPREAQPAARRAPDEEKGRKEEMEARKTEAIEMAVETFDALVSERGDSGRMWASVLKEAIKRRKPGFNESYYGFRTFGNLLEEAQSRGLLEFSRDEKSGTYVYRSTRGAPVAETVVEHPTEAPAPAPVAAEAHPEPVQPARRDGRRKRRAEHAPTHEKPAAEAPSAAAPAEPAPEPVTEPVTEPGEPQPAAAQPTPEPRRKGRGGRKQVKETGAVAAEALPQARVAAEPATEPPPMAEPPSTGPTAPKPTTPTPAAPEPKAPESTAAQSTAPEPATPEPATPEQSATPAPKRRRAKTAAAEETPAEETPAEERPVQEAAARTARRAPSRGRRSRKHELPPDAVE